MYPDPAQPWVVAVASNSNRNRGPEDVRVYHEAMKETSIMVRKAIWNYIAMAKSYGPSVLLVFRDAAYNRA